MLFKLLYRFESAPRKSSSRNPNSSLMPCVTEFPRAPGLVHTTQINVSVTVKKHSISSSWQTPPGHYRSAKVQQSSKHQYTCSWRVLISRRRWIIGCRGNCDHRRRMLITACAATRSQALQGMLGSQGSRLAIVC